MSEALGDCEEAKSGDDLAEIMQEMYVLDSKKEWGSWLLFDDAGGTPKPWRMSSEYRTEFLEKLNDKVLKMVGPTASKLERLLMSQARTSFEPGLRRGRLNASALHRLNTGDDRVFRRKIETKAKNTAVSQLCDFSGSMAHGYPNMTRHQMAMIASYGVSMMLERCQIRNEVLTFTTEDMDHKTAKEMAAAEARIGRRYSLQERLLHYQIKGFEERMSGNVRARFADMTYSNKALHTLNQNCDAEALRTAITRLARRNEERKVLIVYSDGMPHFFGDYTRSEEVMKDLIRDAEKSGVEVIGVGIQTDDVREYYSKAVVLNKVEDLPKVVVGELSGLLLK